MISSIDYFWKLSFQCFSGKFWQQKEDWERINLSYSGRESTLGIAFSLTLKTWSTDLIFQIYMIECIYQPDINDWVHISSRYIWLSAYISWRKEWKWDAKELLREISIMLINCHQIFMMRSKMRQYQISKHQTQNCEI